MRILLAEDDLTSRTIFEAMLARWRHEVIAVGDGQAAIDVLSRPEAPKLCVLDNIMPRMSGLRVCQWIREHLREDPLYVILLTHLDSKQDVVDGLSAGANDYITKPFDQNELQARIEVGRRVLDLQQALKTKITNLETAMEQIKTLEGMLSICMHCHKIRLEDQAWQRVDAYIEHHSNAKFSHSICPGCLDRLYPPEEDED